MKRGKFFDSEGFINAEGDKLMEKNIDYPSNRLTLGELRSEDRLFTFGEEFDSHNRPTPRYNPTGVEYEFAGAVIKDEYANRTDTAAQSIMAEKRALLERIYQNVGLARSGRESKLLTNRLE